VQSHNLRFCLVLKKKCNSLIAITTSLQTFTLTLKHNLKQNIIQNIGKTPVINSMDNKMDLVYVRPSLFSVET